MKKTGKSFKFGDNISTDLIISGRYKFAIRDMKELAKHVMEDADPDFVKKTKGETSFIVAGWNFGMGSSREQAPWAIKEANVQAVLAKNFARIFYRNAFNIGLPLIECNTDLISDGDLLELDIEDNILRNITQNREITFNPIHPVMRILLQSGGVIQYLKKHGRLDFET